MTRKMTARARPRPDMKNSLHELAMLPLGWNFRQKSVKTMDVAVKNR
ncbi:MAG: hypothetical protein LBB51_06705 [Zoogloeaceae bacterium]|jgi:hypothetical protein|nr:hypothetical protein [Zoogloeaceae bacterium]